MCHGDHLLPVCRPHCPPVPGPCPGAVALVHSRAWHQGGRGTLAPGPGDRGVADEAIRDVEVTRFGVRGQLSDVAAHPGKRATTGWSRTGALIAESIPHIVWVAAPNGRTLYFNEQGMKYTGSTGPTPPAGRTWSTPTTSSAAPSCWAEALRTRSGFEEDFRVRRLDGVYRWHSSRGRPLLDAEGRITRWIGTATDIHDRKRLEEDLVTAHREAAEARHPAHHAPGRRAGRVRVRRPRPPGGAAQRGDGGLPRPSGRPGGRRDRRRAGPRALGPARADLAPRARPPGDRCGTCPSPSPAADRRPPPRAAGELLPGARSTGRSSASGVVVVDVTERLHAERFRTAVMSQVADGVYTQDPEGRLTYMNRAASKMLGWTEDELCGRSMHDVVHFQRADGTPRRAARLRAAAARGPSAGSSGWRARRSPARTGPSSRWRTRRCRCGSGPASTGSRSCSGTSATPAPSTNLVRVLIADADERLERAADRHVHAARGRARWWASATTAGGGGRAGRAGSGPTSSSSTSRLPDVGGAATACASRPRRRARASSCSPSTTTMRSAAAAIAAGCSGVVDKRRTWVELRRRGAGRLPRGDDHLAGGAAAGGHQGARQLAARAGRRTSPPASARCSCASPRACPTSRPRRRLGVTVNTVRNHVQRILYKLDVHSRLEAVVVATRDGMLDDPPVTTTQLRGA